MAYKGKGTFANLYTTQTSIVTDNNVSIYGRSTSPSKSKASSQATHLYIKLIVRYIFNDNQRIVMGENISSNGLRSPSKTKINKMCTGSNIINLAKVLLHDIIIYSVWIDKW